MDYARIQIAKSSGIRCCHDHLELTQHGRQVPVSGMVIEFGIKIIQQQNRPGLPQFLKQLSNRSQYLKERVLLLARGTVFLYVPTLPDNPEPIQLAARHRFTPSLFLIQKFIQVTFRLVRHVLNLNIVSQFFIQHTTKPLAPFRQSFTALLEHAVPRGNYIRFGPLFQ